MLKKIGISAIVFSLIASLLVACKVIWTSPPYYQPTSFVLQSPILSNEQYGNYGTHSRPFMYSLQIPEKGKIYVLGLEHSKNPQHTQLDSLRAWWTKAKPTVALVEGRLGFLFSWFQNPIKVYGEQGLTAQLAFKNNINLYSWEPSKELQIDLMTEKYEAKKVAFFYAVRPYFSNFRHGKPTNPEKQMDDYISSRTNHPKLKGLIKNWQEIDTIWKNDFPKEKDWREYSDEWGYPAGYLAEIASFSNMIRDIHLCNVLLDLAYKGETVLVTMGSSHAVKIKKALENTVNQ
jgi:hypothetical protein